MGWLVNAIDGDEHATRLRTDLPYFAEHALKLRPKSAGPLEPFAGQGPARAHCCLRAIEDAESRDPGELRVIVLNWPGTPSGDEHRMAGRLAGTDQ